MDKMDFCVIGRYLCSDMSMSSKYDESRHPIGLIFDIDRDDDGLWIMALHDSDCKGVMEPSELSFDEKVIDDWFNRLFDWKVPTSRHWEKILLNVCHCPLKEIIDGMRRCMGYEFDADKATARLSEIGIDLKDKCYWTSTIESCGDATTVGYGEISEEPMPYTADDNVDNTMRLRLVGHVSMEDLREEYRDCQSYDMTRVTYYRTSRPYPVYFYGTRKKESALYVRYRFHATDSRAFELRHIYDVVNRFNELCFGIKAVLLQEAAYIIVAGERVDGIADDDAKALLECIAEEAAPVLEAMLHGEESDFEALLETLKKESEQLLVLPKSVHCVTLMKPSDWHIPNDALLDVDDTNIYLLLNRANAATYRNRFILRDGHVVMEGDEEWQDEAIDIWRELMYYSPTYPE